MTELTLEQFESIVPTCTVRFEGKEIHYHTPNQMTKWRVDTLFTKEPDTIRWLSCMAKEDVLVDIGANVGMYSLIAAIGRGVKVFAFEPESQNYSLLNRNIYLNQVQNEVTAYCAALSNRSGLAKFYLGSMQAGGSCHAAEESLDFNLQPMNAEFVQGCMLYPLDKLVKNSSVPLPTHIKIDVDGFEHKVIIGMRKTLANPAVRSVLIELNPHLDEHRALFKMMKDLGFSFSENQMLESQQPDGAFKGIGNVIFYRPGWKPYQAIYSRQKGPVQVNLAFTHMMEKIQATEIKTDPSPYFFIENIFPDDFYHNLLQHLPDKTVYTPINQAGMVTGDYDARSVLKMDNDSFGALNGIIRPFWVQFGLALLADDFYLMLMQKFAEFIPETGNTEVLNSGLFREGLLLCDQKGYTLGPHTDTPDRVLSLLFYLPVDDSIKDSGTVFYRPNDRQFTSRGDEHYGFDQFESVVKTPFTPNSLLGFVRTDQSFHGVPIFESDHQVRDLVGYIVRNPDRR